MEYDSRRQDKQKIKNGNLKPQPDRELESITQVLSAMTLTVSNRDMWAVTS
jgi:hypothetical protein